MVDYPKIIVSDEFVLTGRGQVIIVDLSKNGYIDENINWVKNVPFQVGQTLSYNKINYRITSVEVMQNLLNGWNSVKCGLLIKEIEK